MSWRPSEKEKQYYRLYKFFDFLELLVPFWSKVPFWWLVLLLRKLGDFFLYRTPVLIHLLDEDCLGTMSLPVRTLYEIGLVNKLIEKYPDLLKPWNALGDTDSLPKDANTLVPEITKYSQQNT